MSLPRGRTFYLLLAAAALLLVLLANAHLVYVAMRSSPACVAPDRSAGLDTPGTAPARYTAAKPAC